MRRLTPFVFLDDRVAPLRVPVRHKTSDRERCAHWLDVDVADISALAHRRAETRVSPWLLRPEHLRRGTVARKREARFDDYSTWTPQVIDSLIALAVCA